MRFFRRKHDEEDIALSLSLNSEDGEAWMTFPSEGVKAIRQAITRIMRTEPFPKRLVTISAVRQEGVTYLSRAMGTVLAKEFNQKICVVELNWRWPADYPKAFYGRPGIVDVLLEKIQLEDALINAQMENLALIPVGKLAKNLHSSFAHSSELSSLFSTLDEQFDHIILDVPAVTATSDSIFLASLGTAVCMIINQGVTPVQRVKAALEDLDHLNIIGVVLNQVNVSTPSFLLDYIIQE